METKELKIEVPAGYEIDKEHSTFEKIIFKKAEKELPETWEDLKTINGFFVSNLSNIEKTIDNSITAIQNRNIFPTKEEAEACLALAQLCQLRDRYNDGWKPDWEDGEEQKHVIIIHTGRIHVETFFSIQHLLAFKTEELRYKFLENFRDLIEIAKPLL